VEPGERVLYRLGAGGIERDADVPVPLSAVAAGCAGRDGLVGRESDENSDQVLLAAVKDEVAGELLVGQAQLDRLRGEGCFDLGDRVVAAGGMEVDPARPRRAAAGEDSEE
jgi:hypothetical protein